MGKLLILLSGLFLAAIVFGCMFSGLSMLDHSVGECQRVTHGPGVTYIDYDCTESVNLTTAQVDQLLEFTMGFALVIFLLVLLIVGMKIQW